MQQSVEKVILTREEERTTDIISVYEYCNIIMNRVQEIFNTSYSLIEYDSEKTIRSVEEIAIQELREGKCPYFIKRTLMTKEKDYYDKNYISEPNKKFVSYIELKNPNEMAFGE